MTPQPHLRRLFTLDAFLVHRRPVRREPDLTVARLPDAPAPLTLRPVSDAPQIGRLAAEVALEAGSRRFYAPRQESQLVKGR